MAMFNRTNEIKVLRDPIHGYIHVEYQVIWDCINCREFQRLHRIHQLGGDFQVYHTAEHSRFAHSLGVYEIVRRMTSEIPSICESIDEFERIQVLCAALLHDLGHGPFSHFFEKITHRNHEEITVDLIMDPNTEVHKCLIKAHQDLPLKVAMIIEHRHEKEVLNQIISSQLDADRMDYLLRDAYETGTSYGTFDLERILRTIRVKDEKLCIKESGMHSVEDYIMARYHMYWQVYLHPDAKSYEILIELFFKRYKEIDEIIDVFEIFREGHIITNEEFILMDECRMFYGFQQALFSKDAILRDFATRILDRHLFGWIEDPSIEEEKTVLDRIENKEYYFFKTRSSSKAYLPYQEKDDKQTIWILTQKNELKPLSQCSEIVKALLKMKAQTKMRIYFSK